MAPARNVSPAAMTLEKPWARSQPANFATVVVFPVPLTPTNRIVYGLGVWARTAWATSIVGRVSIARVERSRQVRIASSASTPIRSFFPASSFRRSRRKRSTTGSATSDWRRTISRSSSTSSIVVSRNRCPRNPSVKIAGSSATPAVGRVSRTADLPAADFVDSCGAVGFSAATSGASAGELGSVRRSRALIAAHIGARRSGPGDIIEAPGEKLNALVQVRHLTLDVADRLFDPQKSLRQEFGDAGPFHFDHDARTDPYEDRRVAFDGAPNERLPAEGKEEFGPWIGPVHALEALASPRVLGAGGREDLILLNQGVELVPVRLEAHQVLLDLLLGHFGRVGAHALPAADNWSIRIWWRLTW